MELKLGPGGRAGKSDLTMPAGRQLRSGYPHLRAERPIGLTTARERHSRRCWIDSSYVPTGGDSLVDGGQRFLAALDDLRGTGTVTVAVAHSGVTVDALRALLGDEVLLATHPAPCLQACVAGWRRCALVCRTGGVANRRPDLVTHAPAYQQRRLLGATPSRRGMVLGPVAPPGTSLTSDHKPPTRLPPEPFRVVAS